MLCPFLKVLVHAGVNPVLVLLNGDLAVVGSDRLSDSPKIGKRIVVDPNPVADITAGDSFNVEIVTK